MNKEEMLRRQDGVSLAALARHIGASLEGGNSEAIIHSMAPLQSATAGSVSLYSNSSYRKDLQATVASAVIIQSEYKELCPVPVLLVRETRRAYVRAMRYLYMDGVAVTSPDTDSAARTFTDPQADVAADVIIGSGTVIEAGAVIASGAYIGPLCHIAAGVHIGRDSRLQGRVSLLAGTVVGERVRISPGVVAGSDGFGFFVDGDGIVKIPHVGGVRIGNDVEIGSNSTIDCGTMGDTIISDSVKLDNMVCVGHNVQIGEGTIISGATAIGGSTVIGRRCLLGGGVRLNNGISIADGVNIAGGSRIHKSIKKSGHTVGENAKALSHWRRDTAVSPYHLLQRIRALEKTSR